MELSHIEYNRLKGNTINLCGIIFIGDGKSKQTLYNKIMYVNNISMTKKRVNIDNCNWYNIIYMNKKRDSVSLLH